MVIFDSYVKLPEDIQKNHNGPYRVLQELGFWKHLGCSPVKEGPLKPSDRFGPAWPISLEFSQGPLQKLWVFRCFSHQTLVVPEFPVNVHKTNSGIDRNSRKTDFLHPWFSIVPKSRRFFDSMCNFPPEHQDPWLRTWDMFAVWNLRMRYTQNGKDQQSKFCLT